ncbi:PQQ-binding-like beta-propeller repeat protein [Streptomyces sp. SLBN-118]|uniref:serine/threonine-protein kinase n=1 Tax=Streptomyces sp. SLBN-118 TaxID=2768454 RepID=UPI001C92C57B|nr:serine/threonine-protein kinase [Streptomyces sp. SLBN-118]
MGPDDPAVVGPYRLVAQLGSGGMGRVYLGYSPSGRRVAIKVIRPDYVQEPAFRERFAREVIASRAVSGFFTAGVVDADPEGSHPWLATAYIPGPSLQQAVQKGGPFPERQVRALGAALAEALTAIHGAALIHRDLKPANVLLAEDGPRVIDFGISRLAEQSGLTLTGTTIGSPGYMSPEQIQGLPIGPSSDVFSLGSVLAFAATGAGPFGEASVPALLFRVVHEEPKLQAVPPGLRELISWCLAKRPSDRPALTDLVPALTGGSSPVDLLGAGWLPKPWQDDDTSGTLAFPEMPTSTSAGHSPVPEQQQGLPEPSPEHPPQPSPERPVSRRRLLYAAAGALGAGGLAVATWGITRDREPTAAGSLRWRFTTTGTVLSYPRVAGDLVYAASNDGTLYALTTADGRRRWQHTTAAAIGSAPTVLGGSVYLGSDDRTLYSFDARSGKVRWRFTTGGIVHTPVVTGGVAYVGSADHRLYAVDAAGGKRRWAFATDNDTHSPAVSGETVYVGSSDTSLYAVNANTGEKRWAFTTRGAVSGIPTVAGGLVYFGSTDGALYAVDAGAGKLVWRFEGASVGSNPAVAKGVVYVGGGRTLHALHANTGKPLWEFTAAGDVHAPATAGAVVYVGSDDTKLYAVNAATGEQLWAYSASAPVHAPAVTQDTVYFGSDDNTLYAVRI